MAEEPLSEPTGSWHTRYVPEEEPAMPIDITHVDDLREVYLQVFDEFSLHGPQAVQDKHGDSINSRYARELLGTLTRAKLICLDQDGEGEDMWQVIDPGTYDNHTREEAEAVFDAWAGVQPPPDPQSATSTQGSPRSSLKSAVVGPHPCGCGCGEVLTTRAVYRPGHDARHAGAVGRAMAETGREDLLDVLPSEKLRTKALRIRDNALPKIGRRNERADMAWTEGTVTVGKSEHAARRNAKGDVEFLPPGKPWKPASKTAAKTFQEG